MVSVLKKGLFAIGERINGWNVFERLDQFHEMERWDPARIEEFKLDSLKRLAHSAYAHVPLYRQLWARAGVHPEDIKGLDDLSNFPIITKQMLREAGDLALDGRYSKKNLKELRTSGSTGQPLSIYQDKAQRSWFIAGIFLGWKWTGWEPGDTTMRIKVSELDTLKDKIENKVFNFQYVALPEYSEASYKRLIEQIISLQPVLIRSFPFILYCLAQYLLKEGIRDARPRMIHSFADALYPSYRQAIEEAFGCRVCDNYGAAEMIIAHQCESGCYHILPSCHVEADRERRELGDTGPRKLLLTSLTNYAMPLIRYDIADMAGMGEGPCACGRTWEYLSTIYGRDSDIIRTPSGNYIHTSNLYVLLTPLDGVSRFQAVQEDISGFSLYLVTNRAYRPGIHEPMIRQYLSKVGGPGLDIEIRYVDSIPIPPSGKFRFIISRVADCPR
jgi:phenylacetate-CoA ligase